MFNDKTRSFAPVPVTLARELAPAPDLDRRPDDSERDGDMSRDLFRRHREELALLLRCPRRGGMCGLVCTGGGFSGLATATSKKRAALPCAPY
jgi:hypothetical protein